MMNEITPDKTDLDIHKKSVQKHLLAENGDACLIYSVVNIYYLTGMMFDGYVYLPKEGELICFVRKPIHIKDERVVFIRKPEDISEELKKRGLVFPEILALEADVLTYNEYLRLQTIFNPKETRNATAMLRKARMIKTPWEIKQFRISAKQHQYTYKQIPSLFKEGMTDLEFQYELEFAMRRHGSIGIFRTFGSNMEIFMGSVLAGKNAATPSPFDFALGGAGNSAIPIGANGSIIERGQTVMIDLAGNFTAYITDMTRTYAYGKLPDIAYQAHQVSLEMHQWLKEEAKPGMSCSEIYEYCLKAAEAAGFSEYFMGIEQQAKFVGHGVGIEINELPILMSRSKEKLKENMVFAFEPKFVIPDVGAVGIENTYLVTENGLENLTPFEEKIMDLNW